MAVIMYMEWPEVTREQYEAVRADLDWVSNQPEGALLHVASFSDDGFRVVDLWESPDQFQAFVDARLKDATAKVGITSQPKVQFFPAAYIDPLGIKQLA